MKVINKFITRECFGNIVLAIKTGNICAARVITTIREQ